MAPRIRDRIDIVEACGHPRSRHKDSYLDIDESDSGREAEVNWLGTLGRVASAGVYNARSNDTLGPRDSEADL